MSAKGIEIAGRAVGNGAPVLIIAEIGVNHNGSLELAREMIDRAVSCGADCVKFQTFKAERVVSPRAAKADYQLETTDPGESQLEMLAKLELATRDWESIVAHCKERGVFFLSTPYNFEDADLLERLGADAYKIASGQAVELGFLEHVARKGKPVLLSTGMCTMSEVARAVETIRGTGNEQLVVLQCTTNYPSRIEDANLRAMTTMGMGLDALYGYSDHTISSSCALAATALGACVIERHFTLDTSMEGPDHSCSADPEAFSAMVEGIREVEAALGSARKAPAAAEARNIAGMRRSLFARGSIAKGEILDWSNMIFQRPATGIGGLDARVVFGRKAARNIAEGEMLDFPMLGRKV